MAKKLNENILKEELKRFKLISEYTFYTEEPKDDSEDLLLGASGLAEVDDDPNDGGDEVPQDGDDSKTAAGDAPEGDAIPAVPDAPADASAAPDMGADATPPPPVEPPAAAPLPPPDGDDVEVDVTSLVQGSEEAKQSADDASQKASTLLSRFQDLEKKVGSMAAISDKIETLEKEIIKRNPTPIETLEMKSLSSFPYNIKLTDYWKDVEGYDPNGQENKEYVLTQDEVDFGYADAAVKKSFDEDPQEYEEEDI